MSDRCEMLHVAPGPDGMGEEWPCAGLAAATSEDGVRCCRPCARSLVAEGIACDCDPKAVAGNARRRALMAQVTARTEVTFPMVSFVCGGCGDPQEARTFSRWDCGNCGHYWWPVTP